MEHILSPSSAALAEEPTTAAAARPCEWPEVPLMQPRSEGASSSMRRYCVSWVRQMSGSDTGANRKKAPL